MLLNLVAKSSTHLDHNSAPLKEPFAGRDVQVSIKLLLFLLQNWTRYVNCGPRHLMRCAFGPSGGGEQKVTDATTSEKCYCH